MPAIMEDEGEMSLDIPKELPFPPVTREHILHCSYHFWHPRYRVVTPKARLIPLNEPFLDYLRADGIVLPDDDDQERHDWSDTDSGIFSASDNADTANDSDTEQVDVASGWRNVHNAIRSTIAELGGRVVPKLNWSAPKDATWMNANTMECRDPNEIYLLLKSSDFVTHDLEHAFDDTVPSPDDRLAPDAIPYHLVLRKAVGQWNPSVEFRCFVRNRQLLCICQRDLNHYHFLNQMAPRLQSLIQQFFDVRLRDEFPDPNFVFDVYIPPPHDRVWLVDFNPWAPRTDPLLFSWLEILEMPDPPAFDEDGLQDDVVRFSLQKHSGIGTDRLSEMAEGSPPCHRPDDIEAGFESDLDGAEDDWLPELRLVHRSDPEAFGINAPQYSAHKLPKDVVDAGQSGEGLREFARDWQNILAKRRQEDQLRDSSDEE